MNLKFILALSLCSVLFACSDSTGSKLSAKKESFAEFGQYMDTSESLAGIDINDNAIRDDIDKFIESSVPGSLSRQSSEFAKLTQQIISDPLMISKRNTEFMQFLWCLNEAGSRLRTPRALASEILKASINTESRAKAFANSMSRTSQAGLEKPVHNFAVCKKFNLTKLPG